jgi:exo-beta-1,3-glucanase (GH17 family)
MQQQQRRYSFEGEEHLYGQRPPPQEYNNQYQPQQPYQHQSPPHSPPLSPSAHPDSSFNRLRAARRYSRERDPSSQPLQGYGQPISPGQVPLQAAQALPPHRDAEGRFWGRELGYTNSVSQHSNVSPGADNFGEQAAGGIAGIAMGVADTHARESGLEAMRNTPGYDPRMEMNDRSGYDPRMVGQQQQQQGWDPRMGPPPQGYDPTFAQQGHDPRENYDQVMYNRPAPPRQEISQSSLTPLGPAAFPPGITTQQARSTASRSPHSFTHEPYADNPYPPNEFRYSRNLDPSLGEFDPNSIEDDGDDGLEYRQHNRGSMLSLGHNSDRAGSAAGAAATGGVMGGLGGLLGRKTGGNASGGPQYDPVHTAYGGAGPNYDLGEQKSEWLKSQSKGKNKLRWIVGVVVAILIIGGIAGGVVGGILSKKNSSTSSTAGSGQSASDDTSTNGDLNKNSAEIQALMNNKNLHKVFPAIDYTPMYTQYPGCLTYPASQNNVTRDLAVLSQLTNTIRLYGTDCNQTELLLHSIDQLGLNGTIKVWMGVWLDNNATTNARQLAQMYDIFSTHGSASFVGVIVGNEVLFREDMTTTQLEDVITGVKSNLTSMGISLPVASSDLGDNWTAELASKVDYVMANIHPFFAGVTAEVAASWTWDFWQTHDVSLTSAQKSIISETGWPSQGGTDCGGATSCTNGSVAGISEMNTFMDNWVCQALENGTDYFWFEAFDEPWKIVYDTPGEDWEDHWGLMDVNRNLKPGVTIPSCGGKTVS